MHATKREVNEIMEKLGIHSETILRSKRTIILFHMVDVDEWRCSLADADGMEPIRWLSNNII